MEGTNSFEKGLHRSNSPQMQPEGSYVDALNWIRNDSGRLTNEELEEITQTLTDGDYKLLGYCPIQDSFICFFKQTVGSTSYSEIGIFDNVTKQYSRVFNDQFHNNYKLRFNNSIDSVARIIGTISNSSTSSSGDRVVYFVEEDNSIRRFNIDLFLKDRSNLSSTGTYTYNSVNYNQIEDFDLQLSISLPYGNITVDDTGGALLSGVYAVVFRYRTAENNKTVCGIPTKFYFVNDDAGSSEDADGCPPDTQTSKLLKINLTNTDLNYPFIEPIIITYRGLTNVLTIKSLGTYTNTLNTQIIFSNESQLKDSVSISEITENAAFYESAKFVEQKDNVLVLSNLTTKSYDRNFQDIANNIDVYCYYEQVDVTVKHNINEHSATVNINSTSAPNNFRYNDSVAVGNNTLLYTRYWNKNNVYQYIPNPNKDDRDYNTNYPYKNNNLDKGFQRGEVYSFSITPIYKDGSIGFSYHIPAKQSSEYITNDLSLFKPSVYTSSIDYPDYLKEEYPNIFGNNKNKTRHHMMPDYGEAAYKPLVETVFPASGTIDDATRKINILRVKFKNVDLSSQTNNIQGYIIGYQSRDSDSNKRIIDHGFARPYLRNGNIFRGSFANGACSLNTTNGAESMDAPLTDSGPLALQYFSPTSSPDYFDREINTSYSLQLYGMACDDIYTTANSDSSIRKPPLVYRKRFGDGGIHLFFDQWDEYSVGQFVRNIPNTITDFDKFKPNPLIFNSGDNYKIQWDLNYTKSKITNVIKVKSNISTNVDNKYRIHSSTGYTHIEIQNNIFPSIDWNKIMAYLVSSDAYHFWEYNANYTGLILPSSFYSTSTSLRKNNTLPNYYLLFRVLNESSVQYGRIEDAEYIPKKVLFKDNNGNFSSTEINIEGDVYVSSFSYLYRDFVITNPLSQNAFGVGGDPVSTLSTMWYESNINFHMRHRETSELQYYPKSLMLDGTDSIIVVPGDFWKQTVGYNKQYSAESNIKKNFPKPQFFNDVTNFPNRSIYSKQSMENELIDQYRIFPFTQFHDIPKHRGVITDTFVFNNNFYHHTEYGLWLSFFNPNTTQATSQGNIVLGNAGIFQLPSKLVLDIKGGYMGTLDKSGTNTPFGRVFLDHKQGKIFLLTGEAPMEISDLGLFSFFRGFVNTSDKYSMGYDWANKRLLINNETQQKAISYYPKTQTWTSFHTFSPQAYFTTNGYSYAFGESFSRGTGTVGTFYNMDNSQGIRKGAHITYVENTAPDSFKRFDRIEMNTMSGGNQGVNSPGFVEPNSYIFNDKSFTSIHAWTDRQNSTELDLKYTHDYDTNFLYNYDPTVVAVNYYKSSFHAELPLDAVIDPNYNIFGDITRPNNNLDLNADFRAHMKGKFLYTKLSYNEDKPLVLNYIKTFFKPSVA